MRCAEELEGVREGVYAGEERPVEAPSFLSDELGDLIRDVRLALCRLDKLQHPGFVPLCDELPAKDAVLGEVPVARD